MKTGKFFLIPAMLVAFMILTFSVNTYAQTANADVLMKFQRHTNGKVATLNALNQKVFDFQVAGLITQTDVNNFKSKFEGHRAVISVTIDAAINGERMGTIVFASGTKFTYIKEVLVKAGISQVMIDGVLQPVDGLGKEK